MEALTRMPQRQELVVSSVSQLSARHTQVCHVRHGLGDGNHRIGDVSLGEIQHLQFALRRNGRQAGIGDRLFFNRKMGRADVRQEGLHGGVRQPRGLDP